MAEFPCLLPIPMEKILDKKLISFSCAFALFSLLLSASAFSLENASFNFSEESKTANSAILSAQEIIDSMIKDGFNTTRLNDTLLGAEQQYAAQTALEEKTGMASYSGILKLANEIQNIKKLAYNTKDELTALRKVIEDRKGAIDITEPLNMYDAAVDDFKSERYSDAKIKIEATYKKITDLESAITQSRIILDASKSIGYKVIAAWKELLISVAIIIVAVLFGYDRAMIYLAKVKIYRFEAEKRTLENLIQETQDSYFNKGKLSETAYHIKIRKYGELIRDINRQLPLLREEIEARRGMLLKK